MLIDPEKFYELFSYIREDASGGGCSVVIFVAPDPDSVCACRILTTLLQSEFISYVVKPVCGYEYLLEATEKLDDDDIKSVIMLNCGAVVEVEELLETEGKNVYVIDSHRPFNKGNLESKAVMVLGTIGDASTQKEKKEETEDGPKPDEEKEDEEDKPTRRRKFDFDDSDDEEEEEEEEEEENNESYREAFNEDTATSYSTCTSMLLYDLASRLNKASNEMLWLGIIGFTDQIVHYKISPSRFEAEMKSWRDEVRRLNSVPSGTARLNGGVQIETCDEFRFMAYRHWNLYDSMYHSSFVASRLGLWKSSNSRNILKRMLAKMGLPLEQCSQPYTMMDMKIKRQLPKKLGMFSKQFNLTGLSFDSFQLTEGYTKALSAVDAVYSLSGILESKALLHNTEDGKKDEQWKTNFADAYTSLSHSKNSWNLIQSGIRESIDLQKAIVKQGGLLIENKHISMVGKFRYAWLNATTCNPATLFYFTGSMGLTKLALFLQEIFSQMRKRTKPIVLGALNEQKKTFLIVGVSTSPTRNMFGHVFEKAALDTGARIQLHTFDGSVVEIAQADAKLFIEQLQYGLSM